MKDKDDSEGIDPEDIGGFDSGLYFPRLRLGPRVPHYYGDNVRKLFIIASVMMLVFVPLFGVIAAFVLPLQIVGAMILIVLAALTSPTKELSLVADALAAGAGIVTFEIVAIASYLMDNIVGFIANEVLSFVFILALYFALKTIRAMRTRQIGKRDLPVSKRPDWEELSERTRDVRNN